MAQSLNTKVDLVMDATSFHGMNNYGKIMIGDRGFEYYNEKKMNDYIRHSDKKKRNLYLCSKESKRTSSCGKKLCSI